MFYNTTRALKEDRSSAYERDSIVRFYQHIRRGAALLLGPGRSSLLHRRPVAKLSRAASQPHVSRFASAVVKRGGAGFLCLAGRYRRVGNAWELPVGAAGTGCATWKDSILPRNR